MENNLFLVSTRNSIQRNLKRGTIMLSLLRRKLKENNLGCKFEVFELCTTEAIRSSVAVINPKMAILAPVHSDQASSAIEQREIEILEWGLFNIQVRLPTMCIYQIVPHLTHTQRVVSMIYPLTTLDSI